MKEKNKKVEEKEAGRKKKRTEKKEEKKKKVEEKEAAEEGEAAEEEGKEGGKEGGKEEGGKEEEENKTNRECVGGLGGKVDTKGSESTSGFHGYTKCGDSRPRTWFLRAMVHRGASSVKKYTWERGGKGKGDAPS